MKNVVSDETKRVTASPQRNRMEKRWFTYAFLACGVVGILLLGYVLYLSRDLPSPSQLENYQPRLVTHILANDSTVIKELYTQKRCTSNTRIIQQVFQYQQ